MAESDIRDLLMKSLFLRVGTNNTWVGSNTTASFAVDRQCESGRCIVEGVISYALPDGTLLDHKSDIQIEMRSRGAVGSPTRYIVVEVKHASAVTDQFKARAFDMIHMKQSLGSRLHGIMVFARVGAGIQLRRAQSICYAFDDFIGLELSKEDMAAQLRKLCLSLEMRVEAVLDRATEALQNNEAAD